MTKGKIITGLSAIALLTFGLISILPSVESIVEEPSYCEEINVPIKVYGINVDTLGVSIGLVHPNGSLSAILHEYGVGYSTIFQLVQSSKNIYNPAMLHAGDTYTIIHSKGETRRAKHFIIEPSPSEFVIYHLEDSIYTEKIERKVVINEQEVGGEITSSVYNAMVDNGGSPQLVHRMVDVFAWQVDFFRVQKGDKFKVIFEEESVDGKVIGVKRILAAYFEHYNKPYYAVYFNECGGNDYYDECGHSVRRAFMKAPLNYSRISSRYSLKRFHPVLKRYKSHLGTDYAAPTGTPIHSVGNGVVVEAQYKGGNGNYVKIRHNSTYSTQYLHMSKIAKGIYPGATVSQGQTIGFVGSTGLATGPHLCFRFWKHDQQVDPHKVDLPPAKPVDPTGFEEFMIKRDQMVKRLDAIAVGKSKTVLASSEF